MKYKLTEQFIIDGKKVENRIAICLMGSLDAFAEYLKNPALVVDDTHINIQTHHTRHAKNWNNILYSIQPQTEFNHIDDDLNHFEMLFILLGWKADSYKTYQILKALYDIQNDPDLKIVQSSLNVTVMKELVTSKANYQLSKGFNDRNQSVKKNVFVAWAVRAGFLIEVADTTIDIVQKMDVVRKIDNRSSNQIARDLLQKADNEPVIVFGEAKYKLANKNRTRAILRILLNRFYQFTLPYDDRVEFVFNDIELTPNEARGKIRDTCIIYASKWQPFLMTDGCLMPNDGVLDNDNITFNQAVFLLLGLYANGLDKTLPNGEFFNNTLNNEITTNLNQTIAETDEFKSVIDCFTGVMFKPTQEFLKWASGKGFLIKEGADDELVISTNRLAIYKDCLIAYLQDLEKPISISGLSIDGNKNEGYFYQKHKETLGVKANTVKRDLKILFKSQWWLNQSENIRKKIKEHKKK